MIDNFRLQRRTGTLPQPFTPYLYLGGVVKGWWTADDHGTARMTDDGAGAISAWTSRGAFTVTSITASTTARPTWVATSASFGNGAAVTFDGGTDTLVQAASGQLNQLPRTTAGGEIWASVAQSALAADATERIILSYGTVTGAQNRTIERNVSGGSNIFRATDLTSPSDAPSFTFSGAHVVAGAFSASIGAAVDGAAFTTAAATINTGNTRFRMGSGIAASAANFWSGSVRETVICFTLSAEDHARMAAYMAWNSGLQGSLSASNTYRVFRP